MRDEVKSLLGLLRLPGRLTAEEAAPILGFNAHSINVLVQAKLLKPLGNPPRNAVKYFSAKEIEKNSRDETWLNKATKVIYAFWSQQNGRRSPKRGENKSVVMAA